MFVPKNVAKIKTNKNCSFFPPNLFPLPNWWFQAQREKKLEPFFSYDNKKKYPSPRCHLQINKENSAKSHFCDVCVIIWLLFFFYCIFYYSNLAMNHYWKTMCFLFSTLFRFFKHSQFEVPDRFTFYTL